MFLLKNGETIKVGMIAPSEITVRLLRQPSSPPPFRNTGESGYSQEAPPAPEVCKDFSHARLGNIQGLHVENHILRQYA